MSKNETDFDKRASLIECCCDEKKYTSKAWLSKIFSIVISAQYAITDCQHNVYNFSLIVSDYDEIIIIIIVNI